jgi:transcriptional regulator of acetoin/glycerol metabolism
LPTGVVDEAAATGIVWGVRLPPSAFCGNFARAMNARDFDALIASLEHQGIKRTEIAHRSGVSRSTIWRLANGVGKHHFVDTIQKIETVQKSSPVKQKTR